MPQPTTGAERRESGGIVLALGLAQLFLVLSRAMEFFRIPNLVLVFTCAAFAAALSRLRLLTVLTSRTGLAMGGFGAMMIISLPFAYWRGGALKMIVYWIPYFLLFLTGAQLMTGLKALRGAVYTIAAATLFLSIMALVHGSTLKTDRLVVFQSGTIGNPNDLAATLLFGLPCCVYVVLERGHLTKILGGAACAGMLFLTLRTGSRGGLLTLGVMMLTVIWRLPAAKKVAFALGAAVLGVCAYGMLSSPVKARLALLFSSGESAQQTNVRTGAMESSEHRRMLLMQSLKLTLRHPLTGVGPGNFLFVNNEDLTASGLRKSWMTSHNSYTTVSSEMGIPGFLFYILVLVYGFRAARAVRRRCAGRGELRSASNLAYCYELMLISYCCSSAFLPLSYRFYFPILAFLSHGLDTWAEATRAEAAGSAKTPERGWGIVA